MKVRVMNSNWHLVNNLFYKKLKNSPKKIDRCIWVHLNFEDFLIWYNPEFETIRLEPTTQFSTIPNYVQAYFQSPKRLKWIKSKFEKEVRSDGLGI